ncbi:O-antigen ligase family protein [Pistricoccus aurantiacus]|nr:O-antigen ligase family protein [Pistricoccus aurantiacus]
MRSSPMASLAPWQGAVLFAFLASLVTLPLGYGIWAVAALVLALFAMLPTVRRLPLDREDAAWLVMLALVGLNQVLDAWRSGAPIGHQTTPSLPWWPFAAGVILIAWRARPMRAKWLWGGVILGALGAGTIAFDERWINGFNRADNDINAIPFGNLSLLLGVLALVNALRLCHKYAEPPRWYVVFSLLATGSGLLASLLSGTRGGWITLPVALALIGWMYRSLLQRGWQTLAAWQRWSLILLSVLVIGWALSFAYPRLWELYNNLERFFNEGVVKTSIGARIDMWQNAIRLFLEKPLFGWGEGAMRPVLDRLIDSGLMDANVQDQFLGYQLHNEWLDTAARRGLVGVVLLAAFYAVPLVLFARHLRDATPQRKALALAGVLVVLMFLGFGLSQSMFRDVRTYSGYLALIVACWSLLKRPYPESRFTKRPMLEGDQ